MSASKRGGWSQRVARMGARLAPSGPRRLRARRNLLSPACGDLPVGRFVERRVYPLLQKYFASPVGQIISTNSPLPPYKRGVSWASRNAGWVAVDAAALCARWDRRAGRWDLWAISGALTRDAFAYGKIVWSW